MSGGTKGLHGGRIIHGHSKGKQSQTYNSWCAMMQRCYSEKNIGFHDYGAQGVTVEPRWHSFINFLADMGERPPEKTLDRINRHLGYSKDNCRWATPSEQALNRRTTRAVKRGDGKVFLSVTNAATEVGGDVSNIIAVCRGRQITAYGFKWSYV